MNIESQIVQVKIDDIVPNRYQPRLKFNEQDLTDLSNSIKQYGIIQPLTLRPFGPKFEIIAGERRYRAAKMIGLETVPAIIMNVNDPTSAEIAIIENIQRKNLNAIEEALAYKRILEIEKITQEELSKRLGINQSTLSNKIRLLDLSNEVQNAVLNNKISERHARSLLKLNNVESQKEVLQKIMSEKLTVKLTEELIANNYKNNIKNTLGDDKKMNEQNYNTLMNQPTQTIPETPLPQQPEPQPQNQGVLNNNFFPSLEDEKTNMDLNPWAVPEQNAPQPMNGQIPETPIMPNNQTIEQNVNPWDMPTSNTETPNTPPIDNSLGFVTPNESTTTEVNQPQVPLQEVQVPNMDNNPTGGFTVPEFNNQPLNNNVDPINPTPVPGDPGSFTVPETPVPGANQFTNPVPSIDNNVQQPVVAPNPGDVNLTNPIPGFIDQSSLNQTTPNNQTNELVSRIRNAISEIDPSRTKIQTSEIDLDTEYQITIKIPKESN